MESKQWIIPPGLLWYHDRFKAHLSAAGEEPVLISGPRGIGKSLFIELAKEEYQKFKGFEWVNCAHFQGDLARSELFGHVKGAFTGAEQSKMGWIEKAHDKVLILEEVATLPEDVQAKLLTVVEDGEFHKVGSTVIENTNVQIIAATNDPSSLRSDFKDRFFEFQIPPLHERREDILYYLGWHFPELISRITPSDLLALLSYHWPGNVREVMQAGMAFKKERKFNEMQKEISEQGGINFERNEDDPLSEVDKFKDTAIYEVLITDLIDFLKSLKDYGMSQDDFEIAFGGLFSLDISNDSKVFNDFDNQTIEGCPEGKIVYLDNYEKFSQAIISFHLFCNAFFRDPFAENNILKQQAPYKMSPSLPSHIIKDNKKKEALAKIEKKALEIIYKKKGALNNYNHLPRPNTAKFRKLVEELEEKHDIDSLLDQIEKAFDKQSNNEKDFFRWLEAEFLSRKVKHEGSNRKAARKLNISESTLRDKLSAQQTANNLRNSAQ